MEMVKMEGWLEWNDNYKVERDEYGFIEIQVKKLDSLFTLEDAIMEIFLYFADAKLIYLDINGIMIIFDRFDNPNSSIFQVIGRKYDTESNLFLKTLQLGEISTEQWNTYPSFCNQVYPLFERWISDINTLDNKFNSMTEDMSYNAMVLLDAPMSFEEGNVYGFLFIKEQLVNAIGNEKELDKTIQRYLNYIGRFANEPKTNNITFRIIKDCKPTYSNNELDEDLIVSDEAYNRWRKEYCCD